MSLLPQRSRGEIEEVRKTVEDMGRQALAVTADLRDESDVETMVKSLSNTSEQ